MRIPRACRLFSARFGRCALGKMNSNWMLLPLTKHMHGCCTSEAAQAPSAAGVRFITSMSPCRPPDMVVLSSNFWDIGAMMVSAVACLLQSWPVAHAPRL